MSNLRSEKTGLPFIVFISQRDDARHAARIKWSPGPKVKTEDMGSYSISPFGHKAGQRLPASVERLLQEWIEKHEDVLQKYWDGEIEYTEDATAQKKKI